MVLSRAILYGHGFYYIVCYHHEIGHVQFQYTMSMTTCNVSGVWQQGQQDRECQPNSPCGSKQVSIEMN